MMKRWLLVGIVLVAAGLGVGWAIRPGVDFSSPRATARTFYISLMRGYPQITRQSLVDQQQAQVLPEMRSLVENVVAAQDAAEAKFGDPGKAVSSGLPSLDDIDSAAETIQGDSAILAPKKLASIKAKFRRIEGHWRLDLFSTLGLEQETLATVKQVISAMAKGAGDVKAKIERGEIRSAEQADAALKASLVGPVAFLKMQRAFRALMPR